MPRTKAVKKKTEKPLCEFAAKIKEQLEKQRKDMKLKYDMEFNTFLSNFNMDMIQLKLSIPAIILNKTMGELKELPLHWSGNATNASVMQVLDATKVLSEKTKSTIVRSSSFGDDEGYLTTESNGTSGGRSSRVRQRQVKPPRVSRSASASTRKTKVTEKEKYKTPNRPIGPTSYGTITPKVKPNTPQVLLRRPKQGEVALSLQGSPLLTGTLVTDNVANINIPLNDGRLLSIQPQRGLRTSQIPHMDAETKRQLAMLRDNLNKVCAMTTH